MLILEGLAEVSIGQENLVFVARPFTTFGTEFFMSVCKWFFRWAQYFIERIFIDFVFVPRWVSFGRCRVQGCAMWVPTRLLCEGAHRHHLHQNPYVPVQSGSQSLKNAGGRGVRPRGAWLGNQISILQYLRFEMHHPQILRFIVEKFLFTVLFSEFEFLKTIWKFLSAKFFTKELLSL